MLAQSVGNFVPNHCGNFRIGELELIDQPGVDDDLAARAAVGVQFVTLDHVDLPVPLRGIRAEFGCLGDQAVGNGLHTLGIGAGLVEHTLARRLTQGLLIRLRVHLVDLIGREHAEHVLLALDANSTAAGGIHRLAAGQQDASTQQADDKRLTHENTPYPHAPYPRPSRQWLP